MKLSDGFQESVEAERLLLAEQLHSLGLSSDGSTERKYDSVCGAVFDLITQAEKLKLNVGTVELDRPWVREATVREAFAEFARAVRRSLRR
jgi:hypothetical protein